MNLIESEPENHRMSIEALEKVNLPPLVPKMFDHNNEILEKISSKSDPEEMALVKQMLEHLKANCSDWHLPQNGQHHFRLPPSSFEQNGEDSAIVKVKLPKVDEKSECKQLNSEQLKSIWSIGQFAVPSSFANINHIWKVSGFLISGYQRRKKIFMKFWSKGLYLLYTIPRFYNPKGLFKRKDRLLKTLNIFSALGQFVSFFIDLFDLFFGSPSYYLNSGLNQLIREEIERLRSVHLASSEFSDTMSLANFFQTIPRHKFIELNNLAGKTSIEITKAYDTHQKEINQNVTTLNAVHQASTSFWEEYYNKEVEGFDDVEEKEFIALERELRTQVFQKRIESISFQDSIDSALKKCLIEKLQACVIIEEENSKLTEMLNKSKYELKIKLKTDNPIRSRIGFWMVKNETTLIKAKKTELKKAAFARVQERLLHLNSQHNLSLFEESYSFVKGLRKQMSRIKGEVVEMNKIPVLSIRIKRKLYPPYKVITIKNPNEKPIHMLEKHKEFVVESKFLFFRVAADMMRFAYWTMQLTYKFIRYAITGRFGLKGLLYWRVYHRGYRINSETGQVFNDWDRVVPVIVRFQKIMRGIAKSRKNFEDAPDNGFLGKSIARVFNFIECYLIRFLIVGLFGVLIGHSLFNVLYTAVCIFLSITIFIWIIIWLFLRNIIRIFIYDWEYISSRKYHDSDRISGTFQLLKHSHKFFPLPAIVLQFLFKGIFKIILIFVLTALFPVLALLMFLLSCLIYVLKLVYDSFMFYLIIKISGKVPSRDTNMATRIAGPGISRNLFWNISIEDAVILIQSFLESTQLDCFRDRLVKKLRQPYTTFKEKLNRLIGSFLVKDDENAYVQLGALKETSESLVNQLDKAIAIRKKLLPNIKFNEQNSKFKIKFLKQDISTIKAICIGLLTRNLESMELDDYIWTKFNIKKGKYKLLMAKVLKQILGSDDVFESVEEADERIFLEEEKSMSIFKSKLVKRILEGKVELEEFQAQSQSLAVQQSSFVPETDLISLQQLFCNRSRKFKWMKHLYFDGWQREPQLAIKL